MRTALARTFAPSSDERMVLPTIPDHTLVQHIGRGAYGDVWLARNALGTLRAIKVVYRARFHDARPYEREFTGILKYEPLSRTHEGLMQVLHVGRNDECGYFYYVMELADRALELGGSAQANDYTPRTLRSELVRRKSLTPAEAGALAARLASALGHLHANGLVHRDVKPSNVIFVNGQPKLADIGLVTDVGEARSFVGTDGFIPPEGPGTAKADLYSLGKLLYETATGRDRFEFPQLPATLPSPDQAEALLDLNEVIIRACAPDAAQRYASAMEMQADLNLFLVGRSLRRARNLERHLARLKRVATVACVFMLMAGVVMLLAKREERHARDRERAAEERAQSEARLRERAQSAERETQHQLYMALYEQARATVQSGELGQRVRALDAVRRAAAISNRVELRREAISALTLPDLRFEREISLPADASCVALDPEFNRYAVGRGREAVEVWSASDQKLLAELAPASLLVTEGVQWSPGGRYLAVRRQSLPRAWIANIEVWEVGKSRRVLTLSGCSYGATSFHPTLPRALIADAEGEVGLWDLESGERVKSYSVTGRVQHVVYSPKGGKFLVQHRMLELPSRPWFTSVRDVDTGAVLESAVTGWIDGIAWSADENNVAFAARKGDVVIYDLAARTNTTVGHHKNEARTVAFSRDEEYLFSGGAEQEIVSWDLRAGKRAFTIGLPSSVIQFCEDDRRCAVVTRTSLLLHNFERPTVYRELDGDLGGQLRHAAYSRDGRWLAVSGVQSLGLWERGHARAAAIVSAEHARPVFSPDGEELLAYWGLGDFGRWQINTGRGNTLTPLKAAITNKLYSVGFANDALLAGISTGIIRVRRDELATNPGEYFATGAGTAEISPDGRWTAVRNPRTQSVTVHRVTPWKDVAILPIQGRMVGHAFAPGSDELVVCTENELIIYDTQKWQARRRFAATLDQNMRILFAPDGRTFWLARNARITALHDAGTFEMILPLPNGVHPLALRPDGRELVIVVDGRRLQTWSLPEVYRQIRTAGISVPPSESTDH